MPPRSDSDARDKCEDCSGYRARLIGVEGWTKDTGTLLIRLVSGRPSWPVTIILGLLLSGLTFCATEWRISARGETEAQTAILKLSQQMQDGFASVNERLLKLERRP